MKMKKTISLLSLSIFALLFTFTSVHGADFRIADKDNANIHVEQNEKLKIYIPEVI